LTWASLCGFGSASIGTAFLAVLGAETSLIVATGILALLILFFFGARVWWVKIAKADTEETVAMGGTVVDVFASPDRAAQVMSTAGTLTVTVQGLVLGLIFTFKGGAITATTVKVGIGALALGVVVGLLLVSLCSFSLPGRRTRVISALLFNLSIWNLSYGLVSIAAAGIAS
jgi:hypothetical protein